jgi:hypothetical protein
MLFVWTVDICSIGPSQWATVYTVPTIDWAALYAARFIIRSQSLQYPQVNITDDHHRSISQRRVHILRQKLSRRGRRRRRRRASRTTRRRVAQVRRSARARMFRSAWRRNAYAALQSCHGMLRDDTTSQPPITSFARRPRHRPWITVFLFGLVLSSMIMPVSAPAIHPIAIPAIPIESAVAAALVAAAIEAAGLEVLAPVPEPEPASRTRVQDYWCTCCKHQAGGANVTKSMWFHHKVNVGHAEYVPPFIPSNSSVRQVSRGPPAAPDPVDAPASQFYDRRPRDWDDRFVEYFDNEPDDDYESGEDLNNDAVNDNGDNSIPDGPVNDIPAMFNVDDDGDVDMLPREDVPAGVAAGSNDAPPSGVVLLDAVIDAALDSLDPQALEVAPPEDRSQINEILQTELLNDLSNNGAHRFAARLLQSTLGGSATLAQANDVLDNIRSNLVDALPPDIAANMPRTIADCIKLLRPSFGTYQRLDVCACEQHVFGHHSRDGATTCPLCQAERWTAASRSQSHRRNRKAAWREIHHLDTEGTVRRWCASKAISEHLAYSSNEHARLRAGMKRKDGSVPDNWDREVGDVYTGRLWREKFYPRFGRLHRKNLAFMFTSDGGSPFKKSGVNLWPHLLICLNLPPAMRQKPGFTLMAGIVDVNTKGGTRKMKNFTLYITPLLRWMQKMSTEGIKVWDAAEGQHGAWIHIYATILFTSTDYKALYKVANTTTTGSRRACHRCDITSHNFKKTLGAVYYPGAYRSLPAGHALRQAASGATDFPGAFGGKPVRTTLEFVRDAAAQVRAWLLANPNCTKRHASHPAKRTGVQDDDPFDVFLNQSVAPPNTPASEARLYTHWWEPSRQHMYDPLHTNDINAAKRLLYTLWPSSGTKKKSRDPGLTLKKRKFEIEVRKRTAAFTNTFLKPSNHAVIAEKIARNKLPRDKPLKIPAPSKKLARPGWQLTRKDLAIAVDRLTHLLPIARMHGGRFANAFETPGMMYARDNRTLMGPCLAWVLKGVGPKLAPAPRRAIVDLSWHVRTSESASFTVAELMRLERAAYLTVSRAEAALPTSFTSISTHQLLHVPESIFEAGACVYWWLYGAERFMGFICRNSNSRKGVTEGIVRRYLHCQAVCEAEVICPQLFNHRTRASGGVGIDPNYDAAWAESLQGHATRMTTDDLDQQVSNYLPQAQRIKYVNLLKAKDGAILGRLMYAWWQEEWLGPDWKKLVAVRGKAKAGSPLVKLANGAWFFKRVKLDGRCTLHAGVGDAVRITVKGKGETPTRSNYGTVVHIFKHVSVHDNGTEMEGRFALISLGDLRRHRVNDVDPWVEASPLESYSGLPRLTHPWVSPDALEVVPLSSVHPYNVYFVPSGAPGPYNVNVIDLQQRRFLDKGWAGEAAEDVPAVAPVVVPAVGSDNCAEERELDAMMSDDEDDFQREDVDLVLANIRLEVPDVADEHKDEDMSAEESDDGVAEGSDGDQWDNPEANDRQRAGPDVDSDSE